MFIVKVFSSTSSDSTQFHSIDIDSFELRFNIKKGQIRDGTSARRSHEVNQSRIRLCFRRSDAKNVATKKRLLLQGDLAR